ncbi:hypothetical protein G4V39_04285 [Thermosulfuriphilus ammonigenes]|uniref:Uncharacterized protein n=1 Tax=Thermosulfuriphilus ammonigenes TaxID=1936021 RepID=A0A6G7PV32_9BACT|nr:hypothetical protein [Thermosulfuriphilus ammonigenes]MBA2848297.1 glutaredoxin 2 [Thermosulfuriphilus ammonigenes]QIJ71544.1 hypothetical protein G4V39_04285 [Thermosulfuriphilus ammonigenes]
MILFTKEDCRLCQTIKHLFDLEALGIREEKLTGDNAEALAELAWYGLVEAAQKRLPILVLDDGKALTAFEDIITYLAAKTPLRSSTPAHLDGCEDGACRL